MKKTLEEVLQDYERRLAEVEDRDGKRAAKQHAKGKLTARERVLRLCDEGSFVELDAFVEHRCSLFGMDKKRFPGDGVVTGYGTVDGRLVFVFSQDFTVLGGALGESHAAKICKVMDLALSNGAPVIGMKDSGGARIQEGVDSLHGYGRIFFRNVRASGVVPQLSLILGPCAGGAVYSPALTDFTFMVDGISNMYITGPQVIKAVTGEDVSAEELGGARVHNTVSGNASFFYPDEESCFEGVRKLLSFLPSNNMAKPPRVECRDAPDRECPELLELVPIDTKQAYDVRDVIRVVVDEGDFFEVQAGYARNVVVGFARFDGDSVGIVANQPAHLAGCLDIDSSDKLARFVRFCDCFNIPLVTFVDVPGYMPGKQQEYGGIIRHGAKVLYAYGEATVPKITVTLRKSYGGASVAMCNKDMGADILMAWPQSEIAVMGAEGAANIIFRRQIKAADDPEKVRREKIEEYERDMLNPYEGAKRGLVDMVIHPAETRARIVQALAMLRNKRDEIPPKKHGNMPV